MTRTTLGAGTLVSLAVALAAGAGANGHGPVSARLEPVQEVPAISSVARGVFSATIDERAQTISYELTYDGLEGTVIQAHVHFGQAGVNGGVMFFLCGTSASPGPAGTPVCPQSGTVTGMVTPASVIGPAGQGIAAGEFDEAVAAIRNGVAYANVHSTRWPGGEIRGQLRPGRGHQ